MRKSYDTAFKVKVAIDAVSTAARARPSSASFLKVGTVVLGSDAGATPDATSSE